MQDHAHRRWDDVRLFLSAYRSLSFGTAASRLGLDTSTVSRRITAFEKRLGLVPEPDLQKVKAALIKACAL